MLIKKKKEEKIKKKIKTEHSMQSVFVKRWVGKWKGPFRALSPVSGGSAASLPPRVSMVSFFSFRTLFPSSSCQLVKRGIVLQDLQIWALHRDARWSGTGAWWRFPGRAHENRALPRVAPSNHPGWARSLFYVFRVNRLLLIRAQVPFV